MSSGLIQSSAKQVGDFLVKNSSTILAGLAVTGVVTTTLMGIDAKTKADRILAEKEDQKYKDWVSEYGSSAGEYPGPEFTPKELILLTWKCYLPTIVMGAATISCIIGGHSINMRRNAALAGLYSLTEKTLQEYQAKVVEQLGEKKEEKVREAILQDKLDKNPVNECKVLITGKGDSLCWDSLSGQYFMSDIETVRRIVNQFNHDIISDRWGTVNSLYSDLGLEHTAFGETMGWSTEWGLLEVDITTKVATDGRPCLVLVYKTKPREL